MSVDYVEVVDADSFAARSKSRARHAFVAGSAGGAVRLIDNTAL